MRLSKEQKPAQCRTLAVEQRKESGQPPLRFILQNYNSRAIQLHSHRLKTFYGMYFNGRQGPHTLAYCVIKKTIESVDYSTLRNCFFDLIPSPADMAQIIVDEELKGNPDFDPEKRGKSTLLRNFIDQYNGLYEECLACFVNIDEQDASVTSGMEKQCRELMQKLINLNPYATYGWNQEGGATAEQLKGKNERGKDLSLFHTADDVFKSKCLDLFLFENTPFLNGEGFKDYLKILLINLPESEIEILVQEIRTTTTYSETEIKEFFLTCYSVDFEERIRGALHYFKVADIELFLMDPDANFRNIVANMILQVFINNDSYEISGATDIGTVFETLFRYRSVLPVYIDRAVFQSLLFWIDNSFMEEMMSNLIFDALFQNELRFFDLERHIILSRAFGNSNFVTYLGDSASVAQLYSFIDALIALDETALLSTFLLNWISKIAVSDLGVEHWIRILNDSLLIDYKDVYLQVVWLIVRRIELTKPYEDISCFFSAINFEGIEDELDEEQELYYRMIMESATAN